VLHPRRASRRARGSHHSVTHLYIFSRRARCISRDRASFLARSNLSNYFRSLRPLSRIRATDLYARGLSIWTRRRRLGLLGLGRRLAPTALRNNFRRHRLAVHSRWVVLRARFLRRHCRCSRFVCLGPHEGQSRYSTILRTPHHFRANRDLVASSMCPIRIWCHSGSFLLAGLIIQ